LLSGSIGGAQYRIEVPPAWNGTLFLYSHGYVGPGRINPATDSPSSLISSWLLDQQYAIAGSSYSSTGWAIEDAFKDQIALLDFFNGRFSKPKRVIAWGGSLGGIITAGLVQLYPDRFAGAIPICGVLAGGVATWNTALDGAYAFNALLAPKSPPYHQLAISSSNAEVTALYAAAGLDLTADLRALDSGNRIAADPKAVAYLDRFISLNGNLSVPVLTMHTIGDGLVVPQEETAYKDVVRAAGRQDLLRQLIVQRAGHCAFSDAEAITAIVAMNARLEAGNWNAPLSPANLNSIAEGLGEAYNRVGGFLISPPAFENFTPGPYPRPR